MTEETINIEEEFAEESSGKAWTEEISVAGSELLTTLKKLIREAGIRKITVRDEKGKTLLAFPLYAGIAGVVVMGPWTAAALVAAWVADLTIVIERVEPDETAEAQKAPSAAEMDEEEIEIVFSAEADTDTNRCQGVTKSGTQCKRSAQEGSEFCASHQPQ